MPKHHWDDDKLPLNKRQEELGLEQRWQRKLQLARQAPGGIRLGTSLCDAERVYITPQQLSTHMHVVGATGLGKTSLLEGVIKSLIVQGHGVCVVDPHGDLYQRTLDFCADLSLLQPELNLQRRVIPFDVAETHNIIGFNPVARNARVMTYQVVALMEAVRKCWGQGTFEETPRLARWLFNVAYALISANLTLVQAQHMVDPSANPYRAGITTRIENPRIRAEWEWLALAKPEKREERIESTLNRVRPFVEHELIRPMLGQYRKTLDFPNIMSGRKILLVNLARQNAISEDNQHLLGTLLVNELVTAAFARPRDQRTPFYAVIDEFQHFVTKDTCEILDGGRKFGLHLILAHQHLYQLKEKDPEVYYSTLTNARTKVVFGGLADEDLAVMAKELFTGEFDPDEVKDEIFHTILEPVESTRTIDSRSHSNSSSDSYGSISHQSLVSGHTFVPGSYFFAPSPWLNGMPASSSRSWTSGQSSSRNSSHSASTSDSSAEVPWYEYHKSKELSSRTFRSVEEQLYIKMAQLKRQPKQHAAVLIPEAKVQLMKAATVRAVPIGAAQVTEFYQACMQSAGCYKSFKEAAAEIQTLEEGLLASGREIIDVTPANDESVPSRDGVPQQRASRRQKAAEEAPIWGWDRTGKGRPNSPIQSAEQIAPTPRQERAKKPRGPQPKTELYAKMAKVVSAYGDAWRTEDNLLEICLKLDKEGIPVPNPWLKRDPPSKTWERAFANYPDLVRKVIASRCEAAKATVG